MSSLTSVKDKLIEEEEGEPRFGFGDVWTVNVTHSYSDAFSPDGVAIQMVQNFFTWFAGPVFWLAYIPLYERFLPLFVVQNTSERDGENESRSLSHTFYLIGLSGNLQEPDLHFTQEITFGRFAQMLRSFASFFDKIER